MRAEALTRDQILEAAEDVLRRYGPAKANVVDVARALGVSHGTVYRHFASKAALRDAVTERWLESVSGPLANVAGEQGPASERLERWLDGLVESKRRKAFDDPELFATYLDLTADSREVVKTHVAALIAQIARIVADGIAQGEFAVEDVEVAARAAFDATSRFHNPAHAAQWSDPGIDDAYAGVRALVLRAFTRESVESARA